MRSGRYGVRAAFAAVSLQFLLIAGLAAPAHATEQVTCSTNGTRTICHISEPVVTKPTSTYPQIGISAGDIVTVEAFGCVQTGGTGSTWKRYVNPTGKNSNKFYFGMIQVPGLDSAPARLKDVVVQGPRAVPSTLALHNAPLQLGYKDDDYSDNGYADRNGDNGTEDQCKGVGNAVLNITIDHGGTLPPKVNAPFDLLTTAVDPNGLPFNPKWAWQNRPGNPLPNADTQCFNLPENFSDPRCTTQPTRIDVPSGWNGFWCSHWTDHPIDGHINWMPGTVQGTIQWVGKSAQPTDDDYNIDIMTPGREGQTTGSGGHIEAEFDSDETIDHFNTPFWTRLHDAVKDSDARASRTLDGKTAIIIGLIGLDCEHGCSTELHPVYAMAIHVNDDPNDDIWAIFARNSGNEGYCSQDAHPLDTNRIAFLIPRPGALAVKATAATIFRTNNGQVSGPAVTLVGGHGALVEFGLPGPDSGPLLDGELHLQWTAAVKPGRSHILDGGGVVVGRSDVGRNQVLTRGRTLLPIDQPVAVEREDGTEQKLAAMIATLPVGSQRAIALAGKTTASPAVNSATPQAFRADPLLRVRPASVRAVHDPAKATRDLQRAKAMCAAFNGNIPGAPTACATLH